MTIGDMAEVPPGGPFGLVSLVFNTLADLLSRAHGVLLRPAALRCSWPSDLDLMAERADLRLRERHSEQQRG